MKTKQQIKDKMRELKSDVFSFKREVLVDFLTEKEGKSFGFLLLKVQSGNKEN